MDTEPDGLNLRHRSAKIISMGTQNGLITREKKNFPSPEIIFQKVSQLRDSKKSIVETNRVRVSICLN